MIEIGLNITEKEYRALPLPSFSLLSSMVESGRDALYGERLDINEEDAIIKGHLVDYKLSTGKFPSMAIINNKPTGKALDTIKLMFARMHEWEDFDDPFHVDNLDLLADCIKIVDYYPTVKKMETKIRHLKNFSDYTQMLLDKKNVDKIIVTRDQLKVATDLLTCVEQRFPWVDCTNKELLFQVKLVGEVFGLELKGMLDFIKIDHVKKIITPYDIKTGSKAHHLFMESYLTWKYYLQAALYKLLLIENLKELYPKYIVEDFRFLYISKKDFLPVIYKISEQRHEEALWGFYHQGIYYSGLKSLIKEYIFYKNNPENEYRYNYHLNEVIL